MAFEGLDISIGGDSAGAKGAIASVKSSLSGLERSANSAQDSVEELGDEATQTSASVGSLGATAGASLLSLLGLSSAANGATASLTALAASTGTVTVALVGLAAVAAPLVATVGALAAAGASLAAVFGGGIAAGAATHMEELKSAFAEARAEIMALIEPVGELFGPVLVDAVEALPTLVENILDAVGPLEEFRDTLVEFGGMAMEIIPSVAGAMGDLAREALPVLEDLIERVGEGAPGAFEAMMDVAEAVADELVDVAEAAGDLIPPLTETGTILIGVLAPAVTTVTDVLGTLLSRFNDIARSSAVQSTLREIQQAIQTDVMPVVRTLIRVFRQDVEPVLQSIAATIRQDVIPVVRDFAQTHLQRVRRAARDAREDLGPLIDDVGSLANEIQKTANVVIPILAERFGPAIDSFSKLAVDAFELIATTVTNAFDIAINTLEVLMALLRGDFSAALRHARDLARTVTDAIGENFNAMKDVVVSAARTLKDTVIGAFQALFDILIGEGRVDKITNSIKGSFKDLRNWFESNFTLDAISDAFDDAVDGIGNAFERINFGPFEDGLNAVSNAVQDLIDGLNSLAGVNIDIDVPTFGELLNEAKSIVSPPGGDDGGSGGGGGGGDGGGGGGGGGDPNDPPPGGDPGDPRPGVPDPRAATGGMVAKTGRLVAHRGERVLPSSQVTDRGEASFDPNSVADGFDESTAATQMVSELRQLRQAVESDATVSDRDLVRGLERLFDRHGGQV